MSSSSQSTVLPSRRIAGMICVNYESDWLDCNHYGVKMSMVELKDVQESGKFEYPAEGAADIHAYLADDHRKFPA